MIRMGTSLHNIYLTVYSIIDADDNEDIYAMITYGDTTDLIELINSSHSGKIKAITTSTLSDQTLQLIGYVAQEKGLI